MSDTATLAPHYLDRLNPAQRSAAEFGTGPAAAEKGNGPLLVIAGAGSGKTNTLAHRVAHLLIEGAAPDSILLLTFSRRGAEEMARRAERIVRQIGNTHARLAQIKLSWAGTFHGIGARLLREYAPQIGLDVSFTIHDREDAADLMNLVRNELGLATKEKRFPAKATCLAIYSAVINTRAPLADVLQRSFSWAVEWENELKRLFRGYVEAKQAQNVLDYDDLLLYWARMVAVPQIAEELGTRFDHILVDEYQDTNPLQATVLLALKPDGRGLTVVGDDAQSIYAFRGATVRNILDFPEQFSPPAQVIKLEQNYRSTQPILEAANAVIGLSNELFSKTLWSKRESAEKPLLVTVGDEVDQAAYVAQQILDRREAGISLKNQAVLFRASHHSARLEIELTRRNVPFVKFGGLKFLASSHVKDVISVLRWLENPRDRVCGFRVLQMLPGVGPKTASNMLDALASMQDVLDGILHLDVPGAASEHWARFQQLAQATLPGGTPWPAEFDSVCAWYAPLLAHNYEDAAIRQGDIDQLARIAATYPSRQRFLTELTLDPPDATSDEAGPPLIDEDYLILSTIHSAKGQEWNAVYLLNAVDGCLPSDLATGSEAEIEEERRLAYVAMTRAKDHLEIIVPQRFYVGQQSRYGDQHVFAGRTRFIPESLTPLFGRKAWPIPEYNAEKTPQGRQALVDLKSSMRDMWD
ncbi:ATP-dependent helicase [Amantichitinum ursilacus]|uniref:DNA 3'-5' helicase n=1 Tax=Amantichitinum ursilacus TaxID=857265 RepID=A0A0N0XJX0_9NEIS|nr:ATP-dependent helicase [Amantichitinum ursilacus]KPC53705.1 ATP-dependent DNA helicase PcrA [Amantichitinum ursilacus]